MIDIPPPTPEDWKRDRNNDYNVLAFAGYADTCKIANAALRRENALRRQVAELRAIVEETALLSIDSAATKRMVELSDRAKSALERSKP